MKTTAVMIAGGEPLVQRGLRDVLSAAQGIELVGDCRSAAAVVPEIRACCAEVLVCDLELPGGGLRTVREVHNAELQVGIVALTRHHEAEWVRAALAAGVHAYLTKRDRAVHLVEAVCSVAQKRAWLSFELEDDLRCLVDAEWGNKDLPEREREVLQMMALGFTYKVIAERLAMSTKTIESHRARICERLGLETRADLVRYCLETGLLDG